MARPAIKPKSFFLSLSHLKKSSCLHLLEASDWTSNESLREKLTGPSNRNPFVLMLPMPLHHTNTNLA